MVLIVPYEVRTLTLRVPWGNYGLLALNFLFYYLLMSDRLPDEWVRQMILESWYLYELFGHQFLHGGLLHLIGNMVFLWVFGNAVAGVMNQFLYVGLYLLLGICAASIHLLVDGHPMIGASGAISGLLGVYLATYPVNRIHCFYFIVIRGGLFDAPGYLLIVLWFLMNLAYAFLDHASHIAYFAHVGGLVSGFVVGLLMLKLRLIDIGDYDNPTTLDYFLGRAETM